MSGAIGVSLRVVWNPPTPIPKVMVHLYAGGSSLVNMVLSSGHGSRMVVHPESIVAAEHQSVPILNGGMRIRPEAERGQKIHSLNSSPSTACIAVKKGQER